MQQTEKTPEESWLQMVEAYNLKRIQKARDAAMQPEDAPSAIATSVPHRGKFPSRLRVTTIAE